MAGTNFSDFERSPIVQGGLEIPAEITVEMDITEENVQAMKKYEALVEEYYKEPIDGKFEDATAAILQSLKSLASDDEDSRSGTDSGTDSDQDTELPTAS